jgi:RHS repeat-associated protein
VPIGAGGPCRFTTVAMGALLEYIWLPEAGIAPTMGSAAEIARPLAVVEDVETASPLLWYVHVDHLHRPVRMTNAAKATVWTASWLPWGGVQAITGTGALNLRFPGQWFQLETGLHYNWHRSYDPSLGRYTQPDPLGFVDGPSVYGYAKGSPLRSVDKDGRFVQVIVGLCLRNPRACASAGTAIIGGAMWLLNPLRKRGCIPNVVNSESSDDKGNPPPPVNSTDADTQDNPPTGSKPIDQTPWSGDHGQIKDAIGAGGADNTRIDPAGNVWSQNPDGTWTNYGQASDYTGSGRPTGRTGRDRDRRR